MREPTSGGTGRVDRHVQAMVLNEGRALTLRTAVVRLGVDGPVYTHLDVNTGRDDGVWCLYLCDPSAVRALAAILAGAATDADAILKIQGVYPPPRLRHVTVESGP